jgi:hypothetical protein
LRKAPGPIGCTCFHPTNLSTACMNHISKHPVSSFVLSESYQFYDTAFPEQFI